MIYNSCLVLIWVIIWLLLKISSFKFLMTTCEWVKTLHTHTWSFLTRSRSLPLFIWVFVGQQPCPSHPISSSSFLFLLLSWAFVFTIALALSYTFCLSCQINTWMTGEPRPWGIALAEWDRSICVRAPAERRGCWERTALWETLHWWRRGDLVLFNLPKSVPSVSPLTLFCQNCCLVLDLAGWINARNQHDMWAEKSKLLTSVVDFLVKMCYSDVPINTRAPTRKFGRSGLDCFSCCLAFA